MNYYAVIDTNVLVPALLARRADIVLPDMKDVPFYAVTLASKEEKTWLVTGNLKHFPIRPFIVTPAQFLEILQKQA